MCHKSGFLLPNGWVEMHLLCDSRLSTPNTYSRTPALTQGRRKALLLLIRSFCRLIHRIENDPDYTHKLSGKFFPRKRLVRRNVDFLLTCLLNASSWKGEVSSAYAIALSAAKKVLGFPLAQRRAIAEGAFRTNVVAGISNKIRRLLRYPESPK